jgi:hypothetical protein
MLQGLWRWSAALVLTAATGYGFWWLFRPATADQLHARILRVVTDPEADPRDARRDIDAFVTRFPDDPRVGEVDEKRLSLLLDSLEKRLKLDLEANPPRLKREYKAAIERRDSDRAACAADLEAILTINADLLRTALSARSTKLTDDMQWLLLARRTLQEIKPDVERDRQQDLATIRDKLAEAARLATQAAQSPAVARQSLEMRRRDVLDGVIRIYQDREHCRPLVAEARRLLEAPVTPPRP